MHNATCHKTAEELVQAEGVKGRDRDHGWSLKVTL